MHAVLVTRTIGHAMAWRGDEPTILRTSFVVTRWERQEARLRRQLAQRVRAFRRKQSLTIEAAAEAGSMHWRHWQKIEAGEVGVTLGTLAKLAVALRVDAHELLR